MDNLSFRKLLEQYVFSVTKNYIDQVNEETQGKLIELFIKVGNEPKVNPIEEPVLPKRRYRNERIKMIERLLALHQANIEAARTYILQLDLLLKRAKKRIIDTYRKNHLIKRYQLLKTRYIIYLAKIETYHQYELSKLRT
ncbi:hypothetical protein [Spirosoma endbachense]|uniref:Uncharacterized protein n=1 Tax=Spirosoma endbachense TaxID=2666025 RepID=A0A6P1W6L1_9BACT|nr:hypothetical protein [Spirosoma endbachense]QHV99677.1 hypothetical protein GJR95_33775 [Spirosoma endbachense]